MGCDGGTIPRRDELVRMKKRPEQIDKHMERMAKWLHCSISQERLRQPIMACELGRLYNKESVLEYLLDKSSCDSAQHIRTLKDVKELNMTSNPEFDKDQDRKGDANMGSDIAQYICPVTGLQMNGYYRFCYLWGCGCVMSEKALKEVKSDVCHKCAAAYDAEDAIILNGSSEEINDMRDKIEDKRTKAKAEKKAKKAHKRKSDVPCTATLATEDQPSTSKQLKPDTDKPANGDTASSKLTNGHSAASKSTIGIPGSSKAASGSKTAAGGPKTASSKSTNGSEGSLKLTNGSADKTFDHTKSAVYKSLFLSKDQKDINKAHWVTYNPYYAMSK